MEGARSQTGPARDAVVDEHRRLCGVGVQGGGQPAEVPAVAQREQRQHPDRGVLGGVQRTGCPMSIESGLLQRVLRQAPPHCAGAQLGGWQVEVDALEHLAGPDAQYLVAGHPVGDLDPPVADRDLVPLRRLQGLDHLQIGVGPWTGRQVGRTRVLDQGHVRIEVQDGHPQHTALVQVDRTGVHLPVGPHLIDVTDHLPRLRIDDTHRRPTGTPQADLGSRPVAPGPEVAVITPAQAPGGDVLGQQPGGIHAEPPLGFLVVQGCLLAGAAQVRREQDRVAGVDDRLLGRPGEQLPGMGDQEVIERILLRDQHRRCRLAPPPGTPDPLPERSGRPRPAGQHHRVEARDVDAELQRLRRGHPPQGPVPQPRLQGAPVLGQVAGPIGGDRPGQGLSLRVMLIGEPFPRDGCDHLGGLPAPGEGQGLYPRCHEGCQQVGRLLQGRAAPLAVLLERWQPQAEVQRAVGRAVDDDLGDRDAGQRSSVGARVADGRRRQQEPRVGAVALEQTPEPSQYQCDVAAEHPACHMGLVDDDHAATVQHIGPPLVRAEQGGVQEIGVGHDPVGTATHRLPFRPGGVAVEDRRPQPRQPQLSERAQLVVRQRLGRRQLQDHGAIVGGQHLQRGELEAEALARGRARRQDHMLAVTDPAQRLCLVGPQLGDPDLLQSCSQDGRQVGRDRHRAGGACGEPFEVDEPAVGCVLRCEDHPRAVAGVRGRRARRGAREHFQHVAWIDPGTSPHSGRAGR